LGRAELGTAGGTPAPQASGYASLLTESFPKFEEIGTHNKEASAGQAPQLVESQP
jgi:hypothetical protein